MMNSFNFSQPSAAGIEDIMNEVQRQINEAYGL